MKKKEEEEEKVLLSRIASGDQNAYKFFFYKYYQDLVSYCLSITRDLPQAEDISSEILIYIWTIGDKVEKIENIRFYLYRSIKNKALSYLKKKEKQTLDLKKVTNVEETTPINILISKENIDQIQSAIDALPDRCKEVFTLIKDHNFTYLEVAELLSISVHTVNRHMQDALHRLYEKLLK